MPWQDFTARELDVNAPITQELLIKMDDRDRSLSEGPALVQWDVATGDISSDALFGQTITPRGAHYLNVQAAAGIVGGAGVDPRARIRVTDGTTTAYGDYAKLLGKNYPSRTEFPPAPLPFALRKKTVSLYIDSEDAPGSVLQFKIANDPEGEPQSGAGVWFGYLPISIEVPPYVDPLNPTGSAVHYEAEFVNLKVWTIAGATLIAHGFTSPNIIFEFYTRSGGVRKTGDEPTSKQVNESTLDVTIEWPRKKSGLVVLQAVA